MTADEYLRKAERTLLAAQLLLDNGDVEGACNRAYYAMFDAAQAALLASGAVAPEVQTRTHRGLIGAFGLHLVKTNLTASEFGISLNKVERLRRLADYTGEAILMDEAAWAVQQAKSFVSAMRHQFIGETSPEDESK
jgi:uncharacterized protein (UPF0332 family)